MHESLSTMHAYANVHREVWSSRLGTHMESHYRTTTTIGVSSLDVYSNVCTLCVRGTAMSTAIPCGLAVAFDVHQSESE